MTRNCFKSIIEITIKSGDKTKKVYSLTFYTIFYDDYKEGFDIGIFASFDESEKIAKHYKSEVKGFCEYECEYEIDEVSAIGNDVTEVLYHFSGWNVNYNGDETDIIIIYSDCYTLKEETEKTL